MPNLKDMSGQKIGKLLVLERDKTKKTAAAYWICKCDCGNIISVRGQNLRNGKTDCGCVSKNSKSTNIDKTSLIGKKFGRLKVLKRDLDKPIGHGNPSFWICKCECGNIISVSHSQLTSGKTKSCGCLKSDILRKKNTKDLTNKRFGMIVAKKNTFQLNNHNSYIWQCECDCGNKNYLVSAENLLSGKTNSCGCSNRSLGEKRIEQILLDNNILFIPEYSFKNEKKEINKKRYDFAILNNNNQIIRLIEFDGEQHFYPNSKFGGEEGFKQTQLNDKIKNDFAKKNKIPLVRIPYKELNNLNIDLIMGNKYLI